MLLCIKNYKAPTKAVRLILTTTTWARFIIPILQKRQRKQRKIYGSWLEHPYSKGQSLNFNPKLTLNPSSFSTRDSRSSHGYAHWPTYTLTFFSGSSLLTQHSFPFTILERVWMGNPDKGEFIHQMYIFPLQDNQDKIIWRAVKYKFLTLY